MQDAAPLPFIRTEQREVSLLFADVRNFTRLSALLSMSQADRLLCDVLDGLTAAVLDERGYVIDYFGDGLAAMWNAPVDLPDHANCACRAALAMCERLAEIAARWQSTTTHQINIGVGVHTGIVHVGNAGTSRRKKYGPRGAAVHVASRVEAFTKVAGIPLILTEQTVERLPESFHTRRVCRAQLAGVADVVELYTAVDSSTLDMELAESWRCYEMALELFEQEHYEAAQRLLDRVRSAAVPRQFLLREVRSALGRNERRRSTDPKIECRDGVIVLGSK